MVLFWFPWVAWQCQTPNSLSSRETGVDPGIRRWKKTTYLNKINVRTKPLVVYISQKNWGAETLKPGSEFDMFEPQLKSGFFKAFTAWPVCLLGVIWFFWEGIKTCLIYVTLWYMSPLNVLTFSYCLRIDSLRFVDLTNSFHVWRWYDHSHKQIIIATSF